MYIGVKKLSWLLSRARCPQYKSEKEEKWIPRNKRHNKILDAAIEKIRSLFNNIKCIKECGVSIKVDTKTIQGRIDAVCWSKDKIILIEAKSYPITRGSSQDILQLLLYKQIIFNNPDSIESDSPLTSELKYLIKNRLNTESTQGSSNSIKLYLVYRSNGSQQGNNIMLLDISKYDLRYSDIKSLLTAYSYSNQSNRKYLIGVWCFTCNNSLCPFKPSR